MILVKINNPRGREFIFTTPVSVEKWHLYDSFSLLTGAPSHKE